MTARARGKLSLEQLRTAEARAIARLAAASTPAERRAAEIVVRGMRTRLARAAS
jgi:hypothetical protein